MIKKTYQKSLLFVVLVFGALAASQVFAAETTTSTLFFVPQIGLPGFGSAGQNIPIQNDTIGKYMLAIYTFSMYAGGILAAIILAVGGFLWLTAVGNTTQIEQAKSYISGSLSGYVLLLFSWVLLNTINPALVTFKPLDVVLIPSESLGSFISGECAPLTDDSFKTGTLVREQWQVVDSSKCATMPERRIGPPTYNCYCRLVAQRVANDQPCQSATDCESLNCKLNNPFIPSNGGICAPTVDNGQSCVTPGDCTSLNCQEGKCVSAAPFPPGHECRLSDQCESKNCKDYHCVAAKLRQGETCWLPADCQSNKCVYNTFKYPSGQGDCGA